MFCFELLCFFLFLGGWGGVGVVLWSWNEHCSMKHVKRLCCDVIEVGFALHADCFVLHDDATQFLSSPCSEYPLSMVQTAMGEACCIFCADHRELKQRAILTTGLSFVDEPWSVLCSYCGGDPFIELSSRILFSCNDKIAMTWFPVILFLLCFQRNFIKNLQVVYLDDVEWCFWCILFLVLCIIYRFLFNLWQVLSLAFS